MFVPFNAIEWSDWGWLTWKVAGGLEGVVEVPGAGMLHILPFWWVWFLVDASVEAGYLVWDFFEDAGCQGLSLVDHALKVSEWNKLDDIAFSCPNSASQKLK